MNAPTGRGMVCGALAVLLGLPAAWAAGMAVAGGVPLAVLPIAGVVVMALAALAGRGIGTLPARARSWAAAGAVLGALAVGAIAVFPAVLPTIGIGGAVALMAERPHGSAAIASGGAMPRPAGRGGARLGAGRPLVGPEGIDAAVADVERVLAEIRRGRLNGPQAEALARQLFRVASRLRRRLLAQKAAGRPPAIPEILDPAAKRVV